MSSEPQLINGSWWKRGGDGSWLRFEFDTSSWEPGRPEGMPDEEPPPPPEERIPRPAMTHYDRATSVLLDQPGATAPGRRVPPMLWATLAAGVLVALGSLGPWVTFFVFSVAGTSSELGLFTLVTGGVASGLSILRMNGKGRWTLITCSIGFALCAIIGILVWAQLEVLTNGDDLFSQALSAGWGLVIMTIAAIVGVIVSVLCLRTPVGGPGRAHLLAE